jgi:IS5 family transposase
VGRPYAVMLTWGNVSDIKAVLALLERARRMRYLLGDNGYDSDSVRCALRDAGATPVTPVRRNRECVVRYDKQRYRARRRIENAFSRHRTSAPLATRYDKFAANFLSAVAIETAIAFWL